MDQPCYKCGQAVEEGTPFCPHCGAPQIRVVVEAPPPSVAFSSGVPNSLPQENSVVSVAVPVRGASLLKSCALAALVALILMTLGLHVAVAMPGVGFLAVVFYRQSIPGLRIKPSTGAGVGAVGGAIWFVLSSILGMVVVMIEHKGDEIRNQLIDRINQAAAQTSDPQAVAMFNQLKSPGGIIVMIVIGVVLAFLLATIVGSLGGALGAVIFGRRDKS